MTLKKSSSKFNTNKEAKKKKNQISSSIIVLKFSCCGE